MQRSVKQCHAALVVPQFNHMVEPEQHSETLCSPASQLHGRQGFVPFVSYLLSFCLSFFPFSVTFKRSVSQCRSSKVRWMIAARCVLVFMVVLNCPGARGRNILSVTPAGSGFLSSAHYRGAEFINGRAASVLTTRLIQI